MNATITPEERVKRLLAYAVEPGSTDLSCHSEYGRFKEAGCEWIAYEVDSEEHHYLVLQLRPSRSPGITQEIVISMYHDNRFGLCREPLLIGGRDRSPSVGANRGER
jgi:hypothetical protein